MCRMISNTGTCIGERERWLHMLKMPKSKIKSRELTIQRAHKFIITIACKVFVSLNDLKLCDGFHLNFPTGAMR